MCVQSSQLQSSGNVRAERIQRIHEMLFISTDMISSTEVPQSISSTEVNPKSKSTKFHLSKQSYMQLMRRSSPDSDELHFYGDAEK